MTIHTWISRVHCYFSGWCLSGLEHVVSFIWTSFVASHPDFQLQLVGYNLKRLWSLVLTYFQHAPIQTIFTLIMIFFLWSLYMDLKLRIEVHGCLLVFWFFQCSMCCLYNIVLFWHLLYFLSFQFTFLVRLFRFFSQKSICYEKKRLNFSYPKVIYIFFYQRRKCPPYGILFLSWFKGNLVFLNK